MGTARRLLALPDGTFVVAGDSYLPQFPVTSVQPALERYTRSGTLDLTFGSGGTATAAPSPGNVYVVGMVRQSTGAIVLALTGGGAPNDDFALLRYTADGQLDPTFGQGGRVQTDFFGAADYPAGLSLGEDDSLLVAGMVNEPTDASHVVDLGIARYTAEGRLDTTFAPGGKLVTRFPAGSVSEIDAQGRQADGKLVVAGYGLRANEAGEDAILTLARYACP